MKSLHKKGTSWWLIGLIALSLISGVSYTAYSLVIVPQREAKNRVQTVPVERQSLPLTVSANGVVKPERLVNISPKTPGLLKSLLVKEGDRVQQGQILAFMDDSNLQGQLIQAQGQLTQAQVNLQKLIAGNRPEDIGQAKARLAGAQANLEKLMAGNRPEDIGQAKARLRDAQAALGGAKDDLRRNQELFRWGAISAQAFNTARTAFERSQAQVMQTQQALALAQAGTRQEDIAQARAQVVQAQEALALAQAGTRQEDIAQARAQVVAAEGAYQTAQAQLNDTVIRAPFSGVVTRKYAEPGAFVAPTTAGSAVSSATSSSIISLAGTNQIVANVAESNIAQLRLGQVATIQADAYPRKVFKGQVIQIAPESIVSQNVTSFEVRVKIIDEPQQLLNSGMNVNVNFKVGELKKALMVPTVAIVRREEGTGVYVDVGDKKPVFIPLVTGVTVDAKTEILSGLRGNERVFITFPEGFRPGLNIPGLH